MVKVNRDVVTLATGVSYADVSLGRGDPVRTADLVVAHLVGATPDGREFENTYARGAALAFTLGVRPPGVPEGLEEAIAGMRAGGRRLVAVPPRMGFGDRAVRAPLARVPPNASLLYEVELLRCVPVEAAAVAAGGSAPPAALSGRAPEAPSPEALRVLIMPRSCSSISHRWATSDLHRGS